MAPTRTYRQGKRAETQDRTREAILAAAERLYLERWYDEVTLRDIAGAAGVSVQTIVNHFETKGGLLAAVAERVGGRIDRRRDEIEPGDAVGGVAMLLEEYEEIGDGIVRMIALEDRVEELVPLLAYGRAVHRAWVERVFAEVLPSGDPFRERWTAMLIAATDVLSWKILRREQGLDREGAECAMQATVAALIAAREAGG